MFNLFKSSEGPKAGQDDSFAVTDEMLAKAEEAIKEAGLEDDEATLRMLETGFISPNGVQQDPLTFIEQRKALLDAGDTGASASEISEDSKVLHSVAPETEPRAELN